MDESQERDAIKKLKSGDVDALTPLVKAYQHRALRTAFLVTQDQNLAEDVTQSAFLHAFKHIEQFDVRRRFLPWFLRIVVNMSLQMAKRQSRWLSLDNTLNKNVEQELAHILSDDLPDPETQVEILQLEKRIQDMLKQLSPDQRAVIVLRYYVDLTESEMSDMLSIPAGTVKSRLYAARKHLRRLLSLNPL